MIIMNKNNKTYEKKTYFVVVISLLFVTISFIIMKFLYSRTNSVAQQKENSFISARLKQLLIYIYMNYNKHLITNKKI